MEAVIRGKFSVCKKRFYWVYSSNLEVFRLPRTSEGAKSWLISWQTIFLEKYLEQQPGNANSGHVSLVRSLFLSYNTSCKTFIMICMLNQLFKLWARMELLWSYRKNPDVNPNDPAFRYCQETNFYKHRRLSFDGNPNANIRKMGNKCLGTFPKCLGEACLKGNRSR